MATTDVCVSVSPYFKMHSGKIDEFKRICAQFVAQSAQEPDCLYYGFSFNGDLAHCREGFKNAQALIDHVENLSPIVARMTEVSDLLKIEVHGADAELAQLRTPLAKLNPDYFVLEYGFRK